MEHANGTAKRESWLDDLDVRGAIGLLSIVGLFGIVFMQLARNSSIAIPPEVAGVVGSVVGFYFGSKGALGSAEQIVQGVRLEEVHGLVNSRFDEVSKQLEAALEKLQVFEQAEHDEQHDKDHLSK